MPRHQADYPPPWVNPTWERRVLDFGSVFEGERGGEGFARHCRACAQS